MKVVIIYTCIPYYDDGEVRINEVKTFTDQDEATAYGTRITKPIEGFDIAVSTIEID